MTSMELCALPEELLVRILQELDIKDLLSCAPTCRILYRTIQDDVTLQYQIELASAGLEDSGTRSCISIAERLANVKALQDGWTSFRFREKHRMAIPTTFTSWEFMGGILGYSLAEDSRTMGLRFIEMPSIHRGVSFRVWEHWDRSIVIEDFTMDPSQNLIAFITHVPFRAPPAPPPRRTVHLIKLDTGHPHPMAESDVLKCTPNIFTDRQGNFLVQIMHDYIAVFFQSLPRSINTKQELFIWNWKTGDLVVNFMYPLSERATKMDSFSFISPRHFVLSKIHHSLLAPIPNTLDVYDFISREPDSPLRPRLVRSFELPLPASGILLASTLIRVDTSPYNTLQSSRPFSTSSSRILTLSMDIFRSSVIPGQIEHTPFVLFVHLSTLLAGLEPGRKSIADITVPWDRWGPEKSRLLPVLATQRNWICYVQGTRYVRTEPIELLTVPPAAQLRMLDFNPLLVKRALTLRRDKVGMNISSSSLCKIVPASQPTVISAAAYFARDVITRLPYRDVSSLKYFRYDSVMVGDEYLLGVIDDVESDTQEIEVLRF